MSTKLVRRQLRELGGDVSATGVDFGKKSGGIGGGSAKAGRGSSSGMGMGAWIAMEGKGIKKKGKSRREKKPAFPEMAVVKKEETKEERARRRAEQLVAAATKMREKSMEKGVLPNSAKVLMYRGHGVKQADEKDGSDSDSDDSDLDDIMAGL
jgi:hypothetical protein